MFRKPVVSVILAGLVAGAAVVPADAKEIRWGTSRVGSSGHRAITNLTQFLNKKIDGYEFTVQPTPGAILTVKGYSAGQFEGYYGSDIAFYEYANSIKRFQGFKEQAKRDPVQSMWTFTVEMGVGIHSRDVGRIKRWGDLSGVRVFTGPRPWDTRAQLERAFEALDIKHEYMEVSVKTAGSLLDQGRFVALGVYTNAEATTAPWITEASLQADWAVLNPSPEEISQLEGKGFNIARVDPNIFRKKKTYVEQAVMLPFYYGLHLGMDVPEEDMYNILRTVEAGVNDLAQADKGFKQIQADMVGMQVRGVKAAVDLVKIHPGLARYMKEKGVWDNAWDSRVATE